MKKLPVLLMAFAFIVVSCNNNKTANNQNNRDKDDYGKNENLNTNNDNKTNENTGSTGWSEQDKNSSLKECLASFDETQGDLANNICPCVLEKMEKKYASLNEANTKNDEAEIKNMTLQCKEEIIGNGDNTTTVHNWSSSDENQWMSICTSPLIQKMGEQGANRYCSCIMDKLKVMYSSFQDMNSKASRETGAELGKQCIKELGIGQ